jgi:hypothetical protein
MNYKNNINFDIIFNLNKRPLTETIHLAAILSLAALVFCLIFPAKALCEDDIYKKNEFNISLDKKNELSDYKAAALTALYAGSLEVAIDFGMKSLKKDAGDTAAVLIVGQSLLWTGKAKDAAAYYRKYFKSGGQKTAAVCFQYAECLNAAGKAEDAAGYLYQARKMADTHETELKGSIDVSLGYYFLEKGDYKKAKAFFYNANKAGLKHRYLEAMGDYCNKMAESDTPEIYFNISTKTLDKIYSTENQRKAYEYYKRSLNEKPDNHFIKIKISNAHWALGKKERAAGLMNKAAAETKSSYAYSRLSYFLKEENKTNETSLKKCADLLNTAIKLGGPPAELEYEKSDIYYLLNDRGAYETCIKKTAELCSGDEWFAYYLAGKLMELSAAGSQSDYKAVMGLCKKLSEKSKHPAASEIAYAAAAVKFNKNCALTHINNFLKLNISPDGNYDYYASALKSFNSLDYEVKIKNGDIEKKISGVLHGYFIKETNEKLDFINLYITKATSEAEFINLYEIKTELHLAAGNSADAYDSAMKIAELSSKDPVKHSQALKKAYLYAQYSSKSAEALAIAKKLFELNRADKEHLTGIIYAEYWGGDRTAADLALKRLKEIDEKSFVALTFDGLKFAEKNKNKSALNKFKEAAERGGDKTYLSERINDTLKQLKTVMNAGYTFTSDSGRQKTAEKNIYFDIAGDGISFLTGINIKGESKERMFTAAKPLSSHINDFFAGATYNAEGVGAFNFKFYYSTLNSVLGDDRSRLFPELAFTKNYPAGSLSLSYSDNFMRDTPLASELALSRKIFKANYNYYMNKFYYSVEANHQRLSDENSRNILSLSAGYKIYGNLALKLQTGRDNMNHEYNGGTIINGERFMPYEVYYAPDGVVSKGAGLEYGSNYKNMAYSISTVLYGKQTRNNGPDSNFNNISLNLARPFNESSGFSLNFYGAKSEVDPFSDQSVKSTYIGRELYLKYYLKL